MTARVYQLFKKTNPRIRVYERDGKGRVLVGAVCSPEHKEAFGEFMRASEEDGVLVEKILESSENIFFTVTSDLDFTDMLIKDFIG